MRRIQVLLMARLRRELEQNESFTRRLENLSRYYDTDKAATHRRIEQERTLRADAERTHGAQLAAVRAMLPVLIEHGCLGLRGGTPCLGCIPARQPARQPASPRLQPRPIRRSPA